MRLESILRILEADGRLSEMLTNAEPNLDEAVELFSQDLGRLRHLARAVCYGFVNGYNFSLVNIAPCEQSEYSSLAGLLSQLIGPLEVVKETDSATAETRLEISHVKKQIAARYDSHARLIQWQNLVCNGNANGVAGCEIVQELLSPGTTLQISMHSFGRQASVLETKRLGLLMAKELSRGKGDGFIDTAYDGSCIRLSRRTPCIVLDLGEYRNAGCHPLGFSLDKVSLEEMALPGNLKEYSSKGLAAFSASTRHNAALALAYASIRLQDFRFYKELVSSMNSRSARANAWKDASASYGKAGECIGQASTAIAGIAEHVRNFAESEIRRQRESAEKFVQGISDIMITVPEALRMLQEYERQYYQAVDNSYEAKLNALREIVGLGIIRKHMKAHPQASLMEGIVGNRDYYNGAAVLYESSGHRLILSGKNFHESYGIDACMIHGQAPVAVKVRCGADHTWHGRDSVRHLLGCVFGIEPVMFFIGFKDNNIDRDFRVDENGVYRLNINMKRELVSFAKTYSMEDMLV